MRTKLFKDRVHAGRELAGLLKEYADRPDVIVLGLPRGGVPVAFEVAKALNVPLDVFLVRKLGAPGQRELAMGAIASGGVRVMNDSVLRVIPVRDEEIEATAQRELQELERRERMYRGKRPMPGLQGRTVIVVDDGLATGSTMRAAVMALRNHNPSRIVIAVPTAPVETCEEFHHLVDEAVCATTPEPFFAVGAWYEDFSQTTDDEVRSLLDSSSGELAA